MANFMIGCFILGAATVGLIHGKWGSIVGILAVLLWFTGLIRAGPSLLHQFLKIGAISATAFYAYQEFTRSASQTAVLVVSIILGSLLIASGVFWIRMFVASRREMSTDPKSDAPPQIHSRRPVNWWAEIAALVLFAGVPFGIGAAAAQADLNDDRQDIQTDQ